MIQIGLLGPIFGLSVNTSIILTVFATLTGSTVPAFTATLSPMTGLRQVAVSRYSLGLWGSKLAAVLNIVINVGYATIAAILGGQLLRAVSGGSLALVVGIVIIVVMAFVVSFFGYGIIHHYERYAWLFAFVLVCVLYGQAKPFFTPTPGLSLASGIDYSGACLTYFAIIFGVCASWCPIAGDYYVHYPVDTNKWLVFSLTYIGLVLPTIFVGTLGNLFGGIILTHKDLADIHESNGTGAVILAIMSPPDAWGKFASVFFVLSFCKLSLFDYTIQHARLTSSHSGRHHCQHLLQRVVHATSGKALRRSASLRLVHAVVYRHLRARLWRSQCSRGDYQQSTIYPGILDPRVCSHLVHRAFLLPASAGRLRCDSLARS